MDKETLKTTTVLMYTADNEIAQNNTVYIDTAWGLQEVTGVTGNRTGIWVVCGKENGGHGKSYMVLPGTILYLSPKGQTPEEIKQILKGDKKW